MISAAPAKTAPITIDSPTPPPPNTTTVEPARTFALLRAAPTPVVTAQPISAEISNGMSGILMQLIAGTTAWVAQVEIALRWWTGSPVASVSRRVPSSIVPAHKAGR